MDMYEKARTLFEQGWTIPDVIGETGISQQAAEDICREVLTADKEDHDSFAKVFGERS